MFYAKKENEAQSELKTQKKAIAETPPKPNTDILLDSNHTHFILVDDGSEDKFGKEIEFRANLEKELRRGESLKYYERKRMRSRKASISGSAQIDDNTEFDENSENGSRKDLVPMVLIVVQGGPNTLLTVEESIKQNVPVLILAVIYMNNK